MKAYDIGPANMIDLEGAERGEDMQSQHTNIFLDRPWLLVAGGVFRDVSLCEFGQCRSPPVLALPGRRVTTGRNLTKQPQGFLSRHFNGPGRAEAAD